ncbi:MAG: serine--tRNA ligase [Gammaproteobacteria bacterium]|nr:serine--tRNA ligase [Gammaproteobacteria bacterium]
MLDPKVFRQKINDLQEKLKLRNFTIDLDWLQALEAERKILQSQTQALQNERNVLSKQIGQKKAKGENTEDSLAKGEKIAKALQEKEEALKSLQKKLWDFQTTVPNLPHVSVPPGKNPLDNLEVRKWKEPPLFPFEPLDHIALGKRLHGIDFDQATRIAGSRFVILNGPVAELHRALTNWMLDVHTKEHGYTEVYVPYLVNENSLFGTGQLPKFESELFKIERDPPYYLIPTAEVPVTNLVRERILEAEALPLKWVSHTPCFRSEAGSYGKDLHGMIRQHQFEKVELVQVVRPEHSYKILEELTSHAETILKKLELPYRVIALCGGDLGFAAAKTYDLEVWLPSQKIYREISSCSNFESFQARRLEARWRETPSAKPDYVHTLNGSGLAVGRTLIALMENYQDQNGNIAIPAVLHPYMKGITHIEK